MVIHLLCAKTIQCNKQYTQIASAINVLRGLSIFRTELVVFVKYMQDEISQTDRSNCAQHRFQSSPRVTAHVKWMRKVLPWWWISVRFLGKEAVVPFFRSLGSLVSQTQLYLILTEIKYSWRQASSHVVWTLPCQITITEIEINYWYMLRHSHDSTQNSWYCNKPWNWYKHTTTADDGWIA
jgi:hypothetical protein